MKLKKNIEPLAIRLLKSDYNLGQSGAFAFSRLVHLPGTGPRQSIMDRVAKKFAPAGEGSKAHRARVTLPLDATDLLEDPQTLIRSYEADLADDGTPVAIIFTFRFAGAINTQGPFELVNSWAWNEYALRRGLCAINIFHAPHLAGSDAAPHVHTIILCGKRLGRFGWTDNPEELHSDEAMNTAYDSWHRHISSHGLA